MKEEAVSLWGISLFFFCEKRASLAKTTPCLAKKLTSLAKTAPSLAYPPPELLEASF
ncbi:hypothetical protein [Ammoniphilus sp. YIM 78166]|uniref:hypothetical protein n=1 Tax=Ammoniphilus sp. YIM 78166 TaxID=1644106 RepID=UPI00142F9405|nr:hypothetical protein [Ammoniphilus sp. YIM 78166]